ncbi:MAG TPA: ABC transporter substrate-binding protein [Pseudolabrys sp.]|nr:ABC transporter substrate-binding protein [Pseudolabrys sp.]
MRRSIALAALAVALACGSAQAQNKTIKIGVLSDMSSLYADIGGPGSVVAAKMAVQDSGVEKKGIKVEVLSGDHQNKPDIGSSIVRRWIDVDHVDAIADVPTSSVALAVSQVVKEKNKVFLASGPGSSDLTGKSCSPNTIHWTYDTWALAHGTGKAIVQNGGKTWFFLTADYAFGHALERDTAAVVKANGGKVVGNVNVPFPATDFSSFLLQAQASKAKIIGLANAGGDTINAIKQAHEFGIVKGGQSLAGLLVFVTDVHSLGLETAQGLLFTTAYYWNRNKASREFGKRFAKLHHGAEPTMVQAGVYSSVLDYLKTVAAMGGKADDGKAVVDKMKANPVNDPLFGHVTIRPDGRAIHDMYLVEVKKPSESKEAWDYLKVRSTIPAKEAFRPMDQDNCPLVK